MTNTPLDIIDCLILNVSNLSTRTCEKYKQLWIDLDSVNILTTLSKLHENSSFDALMTVVNIANDQLIENLPEISLIEKISKLLLKSASDLKIKILNRLKYHVNFKGTLLNCQIQSIEDIGCRNNSMPLQIMC